MKDIFAHTLHETKTVQERIPGIKEFLLLFSWRNGACVGPEGRAEKAGSVCAGVLYWSWPEVLLRVVSVVVLQT